MNTSLRRCFPELLLTASVAVLFYPLLMGKVIFWGVASLQFYPWRNLAFNLLKHGQLPLWNPLLGNGAPLLANYQTAVFYPPNWLDLIVPSEYAMGWVGVLHLIWAGLGMMAYLRRLGVSRFGQGIGGLAFGLNGYLVTRFGFLSITFAVAWLPWLIWAVEGLWQSLAVRRWRAVAVLGGVVGLQLLAGHAQTTAYSLELAGAYALWRALQRRQPRVLWLALAGVGLGVALAGVQLLPTLELMRASQRSAGVDFEFAMRYSYWPWRLLTWILPDLFGNPATGRYQGFGEYWEDATFVGLICLLLALRAGIMWLRRRRLPGDEQPPGLDAVPFFVMVLPVTLLFALGNNTPVFVWLFRHVPTFSLFQAPARWMLLAVFSVTALGGIGAQRWRLSEAGTYRARMTVVGGASISMVAFFAWLQFGDAIRPWYSVAFLRLGLSSLLIAVAVLLMPAPDTPRSLQTSKRASWQAAMLVLAALDLVSAHWGFNAGIDPAFYHHPAPLARDIAQMAPGTRTLYLPDDEQATTFNTFLDFDAFAPPTLDVWLPFREALLPNLGMLDRLPSSNNFDPLRIGPYDQLMRSLRGASPQQALARLQAMNVGTLLATGKAYDLKLIARSGRVDAYAVPDPRPRAYVVATAQEVGSTDAAVAAMSAPGFDAAQVVIVERGDGPVLPASSSTSSGQNSPGSANVLDETSRTTTVHVQANQSAWLVLTDSWYPGWQAALDDDPVALYRADVAFRAVHVPAGAHTIVFEYRPRSLWWGALVTMAAIAIGLGLSLGAKPSFPSMSAGRSWI